MNITRQVPVSLVDPKYGDGEKMHQLFTHPLLLLQFIKNCSQTRKCFLFTPFCDTELVDAVRSIVDENSVGLTRNVGSPSLSKLAG